MSRSTKKPVWVEGNGCKDKPIRKRKAARAVRNSKDVANGSAYKKESNPWDISDFKIHDSNNPKAKRK